MSDVMIVERDAFRWAACVVVLTPSQQRRLESDPYGETLTADELKIVCECGHQHRDPEGPSINRCRRRLEQSNYTGRRSQGERTER